MSEQGLKVVFAHLYERRKLYAQLVGNDVSQLGFGEQRDGYVNLGVQLRCGLGREKPGENARFIQPLPAQRVHSVYFMGRQGLKHDSIAR